MMSRWLQRASTGASGASAPAIAREKRASFARATLAKPLKLGSRQAGRPSEDRPLRERILGPLASRFPETREGCNVEDDFLSWWQYEAKELYGQNGWPLQPDMRTAGEETDMEDTEDDKEGEGHASSTVKLIYRGLCHVWCLVEEHEALGLLHGP